VGIVMVFGQLETKVQRVFSGSHYAVYQQGFDYNKEACIEVETASQMLNRTDLISNDFILNYETDCAPPDSLLSIIILISCCALSRCGLWLFDLAVNQMFQEWVKPNQVMSFASQKDFKRPSRGSLYMFLRRI